MLWHKLQGAGATLSDPFFSDVSLLLLAKGADASTTILDSSDNAFTVTANGDAQIDTAISKFGTGSILFDGSGDFLSVADADAFDLTGDFTIEAWVYVAADAGTPNTITIKRTGVAASPYLLTIRKPASEFHLNFSGSTNGLTWDVNGSFTPGTIVIPTEAWTHVAAVKNGSTVTTYVNGVSDLVLTGVGTLINNTAPLEIGGSSTTASLKGNIDNYRMTKGVARYTANFTPPTRAFPDR